MVQSNAGSCSYEMVHRLMRASADPTIPGWTMLTAMDLAKARTTSGSLAVEEYNGSSWNEYPLA